MHADAPALLEWPVGEVRSGRGDGLTVECVADLLQFGRGGLFALLGASSRCACVVLVRGSRVAGECDEEANLTAEVEHGLGDQLVETAVVLCLIH